MAKRKRHKPVKESRKVGGHKIKYRKSGDLEQVEIDGEVMPFFRVGERYQLRHAAYEEAQDTLLGAAEAFAETLPD